MPTLADFERDYWAPDREQVLEDMRRQQALTNAAPKPPDYRAPGYTDPSSYMDPWGNPTNYTAPNSKYQMPWQYDPNLANYERNYWAPDREQVLAQMYAPPSQGGGGGWNLPGSPVGGGGFWNPNAPKLNPDGSYGSPGGQFDENALSQAWLSSGGRTPQDLANFFAQNPQLTGGAKLVGSKKDKIQLPNGRVVDAVLASGEGGRGAQWLVEGPGGGGGGGGGGGYGVGQAPNATPFKYDPFQAPEAFQFRAFEAPDALTLQNDPGYQARLGLGQQALERSAAARGTLLTGGTLKDLNQFAQDYGSNEFQNVYNRAQQTYGTQYGQAAADYNANYQNALNAYKTNFETQFQPWQANYQNAYNSWWGNQQAANMGFQNELAAQGQRYNQLFGAAQLGLQGTNQYAGYGQNYANNMGNILAGYGNQAGENITGGGNARAAAQAGAGANWGNYLGGLGNAASMAGMYSGLYGNQGNRGGGGSATTDWEDYYGIGRRNS